MKETPTRELDAADIPKIPQWNEEEKIYLRPEDPIDFAKERKDKEYIDNNRARVREEIKNKVKESIDIGAHE